MTTTYYRCRITGRHVPADRAIVVRTPSEGDGAVLAIDSSLPRAKLIAALAYDAIENSPLADSLDGLGSPRKWRRDFATVEEWCEAVAGGGQVRVTQETAAMLQAGKFRPGRAA